MTKNEIIVSMYQSDIILRYCRTIHPEYDELKSQLIIQLIQMPDHKLITAEQKGYLEYLCFVICKRIAAGRVKGSGMFYLAKNHLSIQEGFGLDKAEEAEETTDNDKVDRINAIADKMHWYDKTLYNYFYCDGYKLREIAEITGINLKSISYTIKKAREHIKKELKKNGNI
jgi:DNA-directed RNA polymerase specialized sigma subunit